MRLCMYAKGARTQTVIFDHTSAMNNNVMMDGNGNAMVHNTS